MIEELLIALSGYAGKIFYPSPIIDRSRSDAREKQGWTVASELIDYLHPGEKALLSELLLLSSYVASFEDFLQKYNSLALFRRIMESTEKKYRAQTAEPAKKEVPSAGDSHLPLFGSYATSLSEGLSAVLKKYRSHLIELEAALCESGDLENNDRVRPSNALQRIYGEMQPYFRIFPVLDKFIAAFSEHAQMRNGGEILSSICRLYESKRADQVVKSELGTLVRQCLTPFRNHLIQWFATGRLESDRFEEFFIQESKDRSSASGSFVINKSYLPSFVNEALARKVLFVGKSVSMMLESSSSAQASLDDWETYLVPLSTFLRSYSIDDGDAGPVCFQFDDLAFELDKQIEIIRRVAAEKLYSCCFEGTNAINILEAWVKNAFFIGKGELFLAFIDLGRSGLSGPISADQLDDKTLLLMSSWTSAMEKIYWQNDEEQQYFEKVTPHFVLDQITKEKVDVGWNAVHLRLDCPPRLTPIFTSKFVADLNAIFRFLLRWRRTQSLIESCWVHLKKSPVSVACLQPKVHQLTSLMLFVVKNLQYYLQADVLETVYSQTVKELSSCRDFEHVLKLLHVQMLDQIYAHCFLKRDNVGGGDSWQSKVGKILEMFGDECDKFSGLVLSRLRATEAAGDDRSVSSVSTTLESDRVFAARVHECYVNFQRKTALLFKILTASIVHDNSACLSRLLLRLDFNNYFSSTQLFSV